MTWILRAFRRVRDAVAFRETRLALRGVERGSGGRVGPGATVTGHEHLRIGENVWIGSNFWCRAEGGVTIGDNTHISHECVIYSFNHNFEGDRLPYDEQRLHKPVKIGRNVWIGMRTTIAPGTTIGDGAIIGLGAAVAGDIPPCAIVGSQMRVLGERNQSHYEDLERQRLYGGGDGHAL